ncbi:MAG: DUF2946 family protein [Halofilum sp. (in: g-proteobacteria)]|nr:DUF2946 family protein [Halofilum sp. (in: g-proteobacteria)]
MDESVRQAMARWPDVPAVYGWLGLDEAGRWRLQGEPITHPGLIAFINRNYACDEHGAWFFQNGPQRGYVRLHYTPWVLHVDAAGRLRTHTGRAAESVRAAHVDDDGNLLLDTDAGPGLVEAGSLPAAAEWLRDADGEPAGAEAVAALQHGDAAVTLGYGGRRVPVSAIRRADVARHFGFVPDPQPPRD